MALLKGMPIRFSCCSNQNNCQLGIGEFGNGHNYLNLKFDRKWVCWGLFVSQKQKETTHLKDDKTSMAPTVDSSVAAGASSESQISQLPKPLTAAAFSPSRDGSNVRVAYQGVPGAYSEAAALKAYPKCETVPCDQFEAAFKAVELWLVDKAVLPIENSVGGSIHRNYDLLLRHRLHIVGEVKLVINHCLLGVPGVRIEELKRVLSHPQALSQCEMTLNTYGLVRVSADDTAGAAQMVASQGVKDTGAVASARAAELYGLDILAANIQAQHEFLKTYHQFLHSPPEEKAETRSHVKLCGAIGPHEILDDSDNITRFLILAREPIIPGTYKPHKTSIVFSLAEGPGVLFKALAVFALREINLTKIESRPQLKRPLRVVDDSNHGSAKYFDYLFYIDFEASMVEPRAQYALGHLQEFSRFLRVLGCYPMDSSI